jgi:hypothetical protein
MRKANIKNVKDNISLLKEQKRKSFDIEAGIVDFKVVQETCREMDILLLPLYFVWEHMFKQDLCEVQFELHLKNSYSRFSLEPKRITLTILLLLFPSISENFSANTRKELLCIYLSIVNSIRVFANYFISAIYELNGRKVVSMILRTGEKTNF